MLADAQGKGVATLFPTLCKRSHLAVANTSGSVSGPNPSFCRVGWRGGRLAGGTQKGETSAPRVNVTLLGAEGWGEGVAGRLVPPGGASAGLRGKDAPGPKRLARWPYATPATLSPTPHVSREEAVAARP